MKLEENTERLDGFRLSKLEIYNWGTFNSRIWTLEPQGQTALLTGANGSGKSTIVDALVTLLVPLQKRSYNQASGAERKRERDERSYVRGAYGKIKDEQSQESQVQYLRGRDAYSVLLAVFCNAQTNQNVTLAQLFWQQDQEIKKIFVVANTPLNIAQHFKTEGDMTALRKRLKAAGYEIFDEFAKYSAKYCKLFGLRSEKALDLFSQTVSLKEIGGLNDFVVNHMLEKGNARDRIGQLRQNYEDLTRAHDAIQKAEQQLARLQPLMAEIEQHNQLGERISEANRCETIVPPYFGQRKIGLLERAIGNGQQQLEQYREQEEALKRQRDQLQQQQQELYAAIQNNEAGRRIQELDKDIARASERRQDKKIQADKYNEIVRRLKLPEYSDEATFRASLDKGRQVFPRLDPQLKELKTGHDELVTKEAQLKEQYQNLRQELESLKQRKSQIPREDLAIRDALITNTHIPEADLPFVGELLKVKEEARQWEGAIERLLRGYGRQLLVPDEYYRQVSDYVDKTNLRGRLVYRRVQERRTPPATHNLNANALFYKLEIKPDTAFHDWLKHNLIESYNYTCCDNLEQFQREPRALTVNGQMKHGQDRHEKDDRFALGDRKNYVLGWNNQDKIKALESEFQSQATALSEIQQQRTKNETGQRQIEDTKTQLRNLLNFDQFVVLNWQTDQRHIDELNQQKRELEATANQLKELQTQYEAVKAQSSKQEQEWREALTQLNRQENELDNYRRQLESGKATLNSTVLSEVAALAAQLEADLKGRVLTLDNLDEVRDQSERLYRNRAASLRGQLTQLRDGIVNRMSNFKRDYPTETEDLDSGLEAAKGFGQLLQRIEQEDLPRHKDRFKKLLDEKILQNIVSFKTGLDRQRREIEASIDSLNTSLQKIDYTPATYIKLRYEATKDREIVEFQSDLRACLPDVGRERSPEDNEQSFQRIRKLIERFEQEERWTEKVTDVRRWLNFSAEERYKEDDKQKSFYSDSIGKSGGQKAKLAFTILASAIAYQYGLDQEDNPTRSFHFVIIDEAFSKSDETNSRYAMELFRQLNLQLLVVTPLDKTHVVEPYIGACHFVYNNQEENDSKVHNMTIQAYLAQKPTLQYVGHYD